MNSSGNIPLPLLAKMVPSGIKPGSDLVVEYDPESQWLAVAATIAAQVLKSGGRLAYLAESRPPEEVKRNLETLGVDVSSAIEEKRLVVHDWYSATLTGGRIGPSGGESRPYDPIEGGFRMRSLKIADLSVGQLKASKHGWPVEGVEDTWPQGAIFIAESFSELLRFNEETPSLEFYATRLLPNQRKAGAITLRGLVRGIHSEMFYRRIEQACDGVVDLRVLEREDQARSMLRIRSLKGQPHDARWHQIELKPNGEATLAS